MNETELGVLIFVGIIIVLLFLFINALIIEDIILNSQMKKHKDYFELIKEHNKLQDKYCSYHNKHISPLLREIDYFENQKKYYTANKIKTEQIKIRKMKMEIEQHEEHLSTIQKQVDEIHLKLKDIVDKEPKFKKYLLKHNMWKERQWMILHHFGL